MSLSTDIHELGNALPAGTARNCVLSACQELLCLFAGLCDVLVLLVVVVLVEVVNVLLGVLDRLGLLLSELLGALGIGSISLFSPLLGDLGFLLFLDLRRLEARVVAD